MTVDQNPRVGPDTLRSLYAVLAFDHHPHSGIGEPELDLLGRDHLDYIKQNDRMIRLAMGILNENNEHCGTLYLFEAEHIEQVRDWTRHEPFCSQNLYKEIRIFPVKVAFNGLPPMPWSVYGLASKEWAPI